jgi:D-sedoheptulose 7-phosphate isomerase
VIEHKSTTTVSNFFADVTLHLQKIDVTTVKSATAVIKETIDQKGKLLFAGNGGSAAIASHVSVDFTKAAKIRAINFNEADLITCYANDYGYENWLSEALSSYCDSRDCVFLISSSGQSKNMLRAAEFCKDNHVKLITLTGFRSENPLRSLGLINFWVASSSYNVIEVTHLSILLGLVEYFRNDTSNFGV